MKTINVALLGIGTVGSGVYDLLTSERGLEQKIGAPITLSCVIEKDMEKARAQGVPDELIIDDFNKALESKPIDILVEVIGGIEPAKTFIESAINRNIHVVTANKELMANYGDELLKSASSKGMDLYFEASVGGGIPIIHPLKECLIANNIYKVMGIVNGTTNYILTKMAYEQWGFAKALADAQEKGYAEADPKADVEGLDAAYKTAILASIAFNANVHAKDVYVEGITKISETDIMYAEELGYVIKLLAIAKNDADGIDVRVHPTMISEYHPLASVNDVYNAIFVDGDAVGSVMFFGQGAGSLPTASAIVGDIIDISRNILQGRNAQIGDIVFNPKSLKPVSEIESLYYLLIKAADRSGVLAKIADAFGKHDVSLASVIQKTSKGQVADLVFTTHKVKERLLQAAIVDIGGLEVVSEVASVIRIEGE